VLETVEHVSKMAVPHRPSTEWRQSKAMIGSLTSLRAAIAVKEVQVQVMRSFATLGNPDIVMAEQELAQCVLSSPSVAFSIPASARAGLEGLESD